MIILNGNWKEEITEAFEKQAQVKLDTLGVNNE